MTGMAETMNAKVAVKGRRWLVGGVWTEKPTLLVSPAFAVTIAKLNGESTVHQRTTRRVADLFSSFRRDSVVPAKEAKKHTGSETGEKIYHKVLMTFPIRNYSWREE